MPSIDLDAPTPAQRLIALASEAAMNLHFGGELGIGTATGHADPFAACPHPDCVLVRADAAASRAPLNRGDLARIVKHIRQASDLGGAVDIAVPYFGALAAGARAVSPCEFCDGTGTEEIETSGPAGTMTRPCSKCRAVPPEPQSDKWSWEKAAAEEGHVVDAGVLHPAVPETPEDEDAPTCEGCGAPATHTTSDDVDVCGECYRQLQVEDAGPAVPVQDALTTLTKTARAYLTIDDELPGDGEQLVAQNALHEFLDALSNAEAALRRKAGGE